MSTGYGDSVSGSAAGDLSAYVKEFSGGGLMQSIERDKLLGDANRIPTAEVIDLAGKPITVKFTWNATLYATLHAQCLARTQDTWTFAKSGGVPKWSGLGYVQDCGDANEGPRLGEFDVVFEPTTYFAFTPS